MPYIKDFDYTYLVTGYREGIRIRKRAAFVVIYKMPRSEQTHLYTRHFHTVAEGWIESQASQYEQDELVPLLQATIATRQGDHDVEKPHKPR